MPVHTIDKTTRLGIRKPEQRGSYESDILGLVFVLATDHENQDSVPTRLSATMIPVFSQTDELKPDSGDGSWSGRAVVSP